MSSTSFAVWFLAAILFLSYADVSDADPPSVDLPSVPCIDDLGSAKTVCPMENDQGDCKKYLKDCEAGFINAMAMMTNTDNYRDCLEASSFDSFYYGLFGSTEPFEEEEMSDFFYCCDEDIQNAGGSIPGFELFRCCERSNNGMDLLAGYVERIEATDSSENIKEGLLDGVNNCGTPFDDQCRALPISDYPFSQCVVRACVEHLNGIFEDEQ